MLLGREEVDRFDSPRKSGRRTVEAV